MELTPIHAPSLDETLQPTSHAAVFPGTYNLKADPGTDLWLKPPSTKIENIPCYVVHLSVAKFRCARVTVKANWERQFDQGGLVLFLPEWGSHSLWVKTGIELVDGKVNVSTVAARDAAGHAADWSLIPVPEGETSVTIEIEREEVNLENGTGSSLWVYVVEGGKRQAVREMTWVFKEKADLGGNLSVGIYAARPTKDGLGDNESLHVAFTDLMIR